MHPFPYTKEMKKEKNELCMCMKLKQRKTNIA